MIKNKLFKFFLSKRMIIGYCIALFCLSILISCIVHIINSDMHDSIQSFITKYNNDWIKYLNTNSYSNFLNKSISGGFFAVVVVACFEYISYVILILLTIIFLTYACFLFLNSSFKDNSISLKIKKWIILKMGGTFDYEQFNELRPKRKDKKIKKVSKSKIIEVTSHSEESYPDITLLTNTDQNFENHNLIIAKKIEKKLSNLFNKKQINAIFSKILIMPLYTQIRYEVQDEATSNIILEIQTEISQETDIKRFNLICKGDTISFEYENNLQTKMCFKNLISKIQNIKSQQSIIGIDTHNNIITHDFEKNHSILIIGKKGSGAAMLLSDIVMSLAYVTSPFDLEICIYSPLGDKSLSIFNELPHCLNDVCENIEKTIHKLHELNQEINNRINFFNLVSAKNIDEYNSKKDPIDQRFKTKLVIISCFDLITKDSYQNKELIENIITKGQKVGINIILFSTNVNNESVSENLYKNVSSKYILLLESQYESIRIFDDYRANQLYGGGDTILIDSKSNKTRFQASYLNQNELTNNVNIIKTFYTNKKG